MSKSTIFVQPISEEKKKSKELKFQLFIKGETKNHRGSWCFSILNHKGEKYSEHGDSNNATNDRMELFSLLSALKYVYKQYNENEYKYIKIHICTESIYVNNVLKEWIYIWKKERFINRPNGDILQEINQYVENSNISVYYCSYKNNVYGEEIIDICNSILNV